MKGQFEFFDVTIERAMVMIGWAMIAVSVVVLSAIFYAALELGAR
jgi:hypothetical protein